MKTFILKKTLTLISKVALSTVKKEVNSACICLGYQPNMPQSAKKYKKNI